jgi:bacillithiol system protein YtxJ
MSKINWIEISSINEISKFKNNYIVIFKHSTQCIVSKIVFLRFKSSYNDDLNILNFIYVDVIKMRNISNDIANKYDVYHESPQLILLKDDKVLHHSSHADIKFSNLNDYVT